MDAVRAAETEVALIDALATSLKRARSEHALRFLDDLIFALIGKVVEPRARAVVDWFGGPYWEMRTSKPRIVH